MLRHKGCEASESSPGVARATPTHPLKFWCAVCGFLPRILPAPPPFCLSQVPAPGQGAKTARSWRRGALADECVQKRSETSPAPIKGTSQICKHMSLPFCAMEAAAAGPAEPPAPPGAAPSKALHPQEVPARQAA